MSTFAVSEQRQVDGTSYVRVARDREPSRRALSSAAEFIGDVVNQIAPEMRLAAAVLRQATVDLRRFRDSKEAARCEMYWDASRWFILNDTKWPYSFTNVCCSLGLSPEGVRNEVFADARFVWVAHSGTCRLRHSNAAGGLALTSLFCLAAAVLSHSQSYENATSLEDLDGSLAKAHVATRACSRSVLLAQHHVLQFFQRTGLALAEGAPVLGSTRA